VLPASLIFLKFGTEFSMFLDTGVLPTSLRYLELGDKYRHRLCVHDLRSLHTLIWGHRRLGL